MAAAPHQLPGRLRACHVLSTGCIPSEPSAAVLKQVFANTNLAEARGTCRIITERLDAPTCAHRARCQGVSSRSKAWRCQSWVGAEGKTSPHCGKPAPFASPVLRNSQIAPFETLETQNQPKALTSAGKSAAQLVLVAEHQRWRKANEAKPRGDAPASPGTHTHTSEGNLRGLGRCTHRAPTTSCCSGRGKPNQSEPQQGTAIVSLPKNTSHRADKVWRAAPELAELSQPYQPFSLARWGCSCGAAALPCRRTLPTGSEQKGKQPHEAEPRPRGQHGWHSEP